MDDAGKTAQTDVAVLPPKPANVQLVRSADGKEITLSWEFTDASIIDGFLLRRTADKVTYTDFAISPAATRGRLVRPFSSASSSPRSTSGTCRRTS